MGISVKNLVIMSKRKPGAESPGQHQAVPPSNIRKFAALARASCQSVWIEASAVAVAAVST